MQDLRKVQETNKRTLIISLPKRWGARFPVSAGDHLQLDLQSDGSVVMRRHGHGATTPATSITGAGVGPDEVLARMTEPFLQGASTISVTGLAAWLEADLARFRLAARDRFGGEVTEESSEELQVLFLGADRPEQLSLACRRLVQLGCEALRGNAVDAQTVERYRMLAGRLLFLGARRLESGSFDARTGSTVLQLGAITAMLVAAANGQEKASEEVVEAFRLAATAAMNGNPVAPFTGSDAGGCGWLAQAAINALATAG